jgi:predicted glycosyltransferase
MTNDQKFRLLLLCTELEGIAYSMKNAAKQETTNYTQEIQKDAIERYNSKMNTLMTEINILCTQDGYNRA